MRRVLIRVTLTGRRSRSQLYVIPNVHISELCTSSSALHVAEDRPILVRDFIRDALYNPQHGYFAARPEAVGMLPQPISFNLMKGRRHYMQHLHELYKQNDISWFTPIELFKPWYGYALAKYILRNHNPKFPLRIFEIGGGTGTCARNILDYIKIEAPSVYDSMRYVSVEISNALANTQLNSIHVEKTHRSHFFVECRDACKRSGWGKVDEHPCFVIMLEVLDNQPHDLIYKENSSCPWLETHVTKGPNSATLNEVHQPVADPLILRCIKIMECGSKSISPWLLALKNFVYKVIPFQKKAWIPTASLQLLETLYTVRPNMALIISDFSVLPDVKVQGERAPLVARKKDGVTEDLSSYLDVKGDADIFFPTDFHLLRKFDLYCHSTLRSCATDVTGMHGKRKSHIVTMSQFMRQYAEISKTETKNGFNPLLDDYSNMKFYLTGWM